MDATSSTQFNPIYWASQRPEVAALQKMEVDIEDVKENGRTNTAIQLAIKGFTIDTEIHIWGQGAFAIMSLRKRYLYKWVPTALMPPVQMAPGVTAPGLVPYDPNNPPSGAIKVSLDIGDGVNTFGDYPPFNPPPKPVPVPVVASMSLVGIPEGGGYFQALAAALGQLKDGQEYDGDPRGKFIFHVSENPFAAAGPNFTVTWFQQVAG